MKLVESLAMTILLSLSCSLASADVLLKSVEASKLCADAGDRANAKFLVATKDEDIFAADAATRIWVTTVYRDSAYLVTHQDMDRVTSYCRKYLKALAFEPALSAQ